MISWFVIGLAFNAVCAYVGWKRLNAERGRQQVRSILTSIAVWASYLVHLTITLLAAVFQVWQVPLGDWFSLGLGSAAAGTGIVLFTAGTVSFGSLGRMSGRVNGKLVTIGIYRWSRNPQNLGWMLCLSGMAILGQSGLAVLLAGLFWTGFVAYVGGEERQLEAEFGDEYRAYLVWSHRYFGPSRRVAQPGAVRTRLSTEVPDQDEAHDPAQRCTEPHQPSLVRPAGSALT